MNVGAAERNKWTAPWVYFLRDRKCCELFLEEDEEQIASNFLESNLYYPKVWMIKFSNRRNSWSNAWMGNSGRAYPYYSQTLSPLVRLRNDLFIVR